MKNDSLGNRMKGYESIYKNKLIKKVPVLVRVDGKAFHTLTKNAVKPFDVDIMYSMYDAAFNTMNQMQGCKAAYVQSDECTFLLTDYDTIETDAWFGYDHQKIVSITAAYMSVYFGKILSFTDFESNYTPLFDARAFNVPREDVVNCFVWRCKDWKRNSLSMYCQSFFSHKELHGKNQAAQHEMLYSVGKNWATDLKPSEKNGIFIYKEAECITRDSTVKADYESVAKVIDKFL